MAGDLSGLTATGRCISSNERKQAMRIAHSNSTRSSSGNRVGASCSADTISVGRPGEKGGKRRRPLSTQVNTCFQEADGVCQRTQSAMTKDLGTQSRHGVSQLGYASYLVENNSGYYDAPKAKMNSS